MFAPRNSNPRTFSEKNVAIPAKNDKKFKKLKDVDQTEDFVEALSENNGNARKSSSDQGTKTSQFVPENLEENSFVARDFFRSQTVRSSKSAQGSTSTGSKSVLVKKLKYRSENPSPTRSNDGYSSQASISDDNNGKNSKSRVKTRVKIATGLFPGLQELSGQAASQDSNLNMAKNVDGRQDEKIPKSTSKNGKAPTAKAYFQNLTSSSHNTAGTDGLNALGDEAQIPSNSEIEHPVGGNGPASTESPFKPYSAQRITSSNEIRPALVPRTEADTTGEPYYAIGSSSEPRKTSSKKQLAHSQKPSGWLEGKIGQLWSYSSPLRGKKPRRSKSSDNQSPERPRAQENAEDSSSTVQKRLFEEGSTAASMPALLVSPNRDCLHLKEEESDVFLTPEEASQALKPIREENSGKAGKDEADCFPETGLGGWVQKELRSLQQGGSSDRKQEEQGSLLKLREELLMLSRKREMLGGEIKPGWAKNWQEIADEELRAVAEWKEAGNEGRDVGVDVKVDMSEFVATQKEKAERAEIRAMAAEEEAKKLRDAEKQGEGKQETSRKEQGSNRKKLRRSKSGSEISRMRQRNSPRRPGKTAVEGVRISREEDEQLTSQGFFTSYTSEVFDEDEVQQSCDSEWDVLQPDRNRAGGKWTDVDWNYEQKKGRNRRKGVGTWGRGWDKKNIDVSIMQKMQEVERVAKQERDEEWKEELAKVVEEDKVLRQENEKLKAQLAKAVVQRKVGRVGGKAGAENVQKSEREGSEKSVAAREAEGDVFRRVLELEWERDMLQAKVKEYGMENANLSFKVKEMEGKVGVGEKPGEQKEKLFWYENRLKQALADGESKQASCQLVQRQLSEQRSISEALQVQLAVEKEAMAESEGKLRELEKVCERERIRRKEAASELQRFRAEMASKSDTEKALLFRDKQIEEMKLQLSAARLKMAEKEAQVVQLRAGMEDREDLIRTASEQVGNAASDMQKLMHLKQELSETTLENQKLQKTVENLQAETAGLRESLCSALSMADSAKQQVEEERKRSERSEKLLKETAATSEKLGTKLWETRAELERAGKSAAEMERRNLDEKELRQRAESELDKKKQVENILRDELFKVEDRLRAAAEQVETARKEHEREVAKREREADELGKLLMGKDISEKAMAERMAAKEQELSEAKRESQGRLEELFSLREERASLRAQLDLLEKTRTELNAKIEEIRGDLMQSKQKLHIEEESRRRMEQSTEMEFQKAIGMQKKAQREIDNASEAYGDMEREIAELKKQNEGLERMALEQGGEIEILRDYLTMRGIDVEEALLRP